MAGGQPRAEGTDSIRAWLAPPPGAGLLGIDVSLLDLGDEDERALLVRAQHPEFAAALERGEDEVEVGGEVINPRLHLALHEVVANQLWADEPPETRLVAERLLRDGFDRHEVLHMIGSAVAGQLWSAQQAGAPVDPEDYVAALDGLPEGWGAPSTSARNGVDPAELDLGVEEIDEAAEQAFEDTQEWLLDDHERWLADNGLDTEGWVAHQLLHLKWSYLDGHLGRWRVADLYEILLELLPRKVVVDEPDLPLIAPAISCFLRYLDDVGLLAADSDPLPRLLDALGRLEGPLLEAMADPANFGMAKSLFAGMAADGTDLTDQDAVQAWMEDFNALPADERARRLPGRLAPPAVPQLPLPDDDALAARALAAPAMRQLAAFLDWVGDGRTLTQKGNLKLADGKALVALLGTADRADERIGDRTFSTRSTAELHGVDLVHRLALKSRLTRKQHGRVQRTKRGGRLPEDPLSAWRDIVLAMIDLGMVGSGRDDRYGLRWWEGHLEEGVVELLSAAAVAGVAMPVEALSKAAHEGLAESYDLDSLPEAALRHLPSSLEWGVGALVDRLVWLGAATREGVVVEDEQWGYGRRSGGEFALTDLGRWFVQPVLVARGYRTPVIGELADAGADALLDGVADWPLEAVHAEVRAWAAARDTAVDELAAVAREAPAPDLRVLAFEALNVIGDEAVPAVRALADDPSLRPLATLWLVGRGVEQPHAFARDDAPAAFVQALAVALVAGGPDAVAAALPDDMPVDERITMIEALWRVDDPYTEPVLEALGTEADKRVAKAARKALFKHRSAGPGAPGRP